MSKFCGTCGSPLTDGQKFCGKCGVANLTFNRLPHRRSQPPCTASTPSCLNAAGRRFSPGPGALQHAAQSRHRRRRHHFCRRHCRARRRVLRSAQGQRKSSGRYAPGGGRQHPTQHEADLPPGPESGILGSVERRRQRWLQRRSMPLSQQRRCIEGSRHRDHPRTGTGHWLQLHRQRRPGRHGLKTYDLHGQQPGKKQWHQSHG